MLACFMLAYSASNVLSLYCKGQMNITYAETKQLQINPFSSIVGKELHISPQRLSLSKLYI